MANVNLLNHVFRRLCVFPSQWQSFLITSHRSVVYRRSFASTTNSGKRAKPKRRTLLLGLAGFGLGTAVGVAGYGWQQLQIKPQAIANTSESQEIILTEAPPYSDKPSRRIISPTDNTGLKLVLYQYQTCPFCCKVRAFLDYHGLSYDIVEVNPVMRQQVKWSKYRKVPILVAEVKDGYQQMNDSTMIISALTSYFHDHGSGLSSVLVCFPNIQFQDEDGKMKNEILNRYSLMFQGDIPKGRTKEDIVEERKWRKWADDTLVHTLSPNVYRTPQEALQAFTWFSEVGEWEKNFASWERFLVVYVGAAAMWIIGKRLQKRHNLYQDVRKSLYEECNFWVKSIKQKGTPFMGGSSPNLADLSVFGVLNSIEGCDAFKDLLQNSKIGPWYTDMKSKVSSHAGSHPV